MKTTLDQPVPSTKEKASPMYWEMDDSPYFAALSPCQQSGVYSFLLSVSVVKTLESELQSPLSEITPRQIIDYCSKHLPAEGDLIGPSSSVRVMRD